LGAAFMPVALSGFFLSPYGIVMASTAGSFVVMLAVLVVAQRLKDTMAILIVGLMFGSFTSAIVGVLTYFSTAEQLRKFTFWSLGSLGNLSWENILVLTAASVTGLLLAALCIKPLNALLLGERYAASMGINFSRTRLTIIVATSILAGSITAFAGPVAFVGLAVPHMAKLVYRTSSHFILFFATILIGAIILLLCDTLTQIGGDSYTLPINAVTSIIGAPVVIWLLLRKRKGAFV
jgi:iron complex transport system permease protein